MPGEVEKMKKIATNDKLHTWERTKAVEALSEIGSKEVMLALLDIAGTEMLYAWERDHTLYSSAQL